MHEFVKLAKTAIEQYVKDDRIISAEGCLSNMPEAKGRAGVFVSLKIGGDLRGCIGTIEPQTGSIAEEIIRNAISSADRDPRFEPVDVEELDVLSYSVDVLTTPEPVKDITCLDAKRYGVIVKKGGRKGLLLPDLDGVDSVSEQLRIACLKAGITPGDPDIKIERFEVKRYK